MKYFPFSHCLSVSSFFNMLTLCLLSLAKFPQSMGPLQFRTHVSYQHIYQHQQVTGGPEGTRFPSEPELAGCREKAMIV